MKKVQTVGITGAGGRIGLILKAGLSDIYELKEFLHDDIDFSRASQVQGAFEGLDAVIHLAADGRPVAPWESVSKNNIEATYQAINECVRAGVKKLVFASSNHTMHGHTILTTTETLDPEKDMSMKIEDMPNPDSLYAVSKLFGENLGKLYSERYGLSFIGLRIGWVTLENDPSLMRGTRAEQYMRAMFLSHRDCVHAFQRALEVDTKFLIGYIVSNNDRRVFDLESTRIQLGYDPQDNAEIFFKWCML